MLFHSHFGGEREVHARRTRPDNARDGWQGHFREEFDRALESLTTRLATASGYGPMTMLSSINRAVEAANEIQRGYNRDRAATVEAELRAEAARQAEEDARVPSGP
ncbi:MAG: hypothetical protein ACR2JF_06085 [Iamia sp.]